MRMGPIRATRILILVQAARTCQSPPPLYNLHQQVVGDEKLEGRR